MQIRDYWQILSKEERKRFAADAGSTVPYITRHLIGPSPTREPSPRFLRKLADASNGYLTRLDLFNYFYNTDRWDQGKSA